FNRGGNFSIEPEAIALALTLDGDSFIVRGLFVNAPGSPVGPIPLLPSLISGPAVASEAAVYMPDDTDIFVSASLDLSQMYDAISATIKKSPPATGPTARGPKQNKPETVEPAGSAFEKANGFKIKDDLLTTLGNEIAVSLPAKYLGAEFGLSTANVK